MTNRVGCIGIGVAAAMCDPHAAGRTHDRIERRDQSACRTNPLDLRATSLMDVRLPVRDHHDPYTRQPLFQERDQAPA